MSDDRTLRLLEAFSGVEEELLARCESAVVDGDAGLQKNVSGINEQKKIISMADRLKENFKKSGWRYGSAVAAVLCLLIVGWAGFSGMLRVTTNDSAAFEAIMDEATGGTEPSANGAMQEVASATTSHYKIAENQEKDTVTGETDGSTDSGLGNENGMFSGQASAEEAIGKAQPENSTNSVDAYKDVSASMEKADDTDMLRQESVIVYKDTAEGCKEFVYEKVSEAEAREHGTFGVYVPTKLPEGYVWEGAYFAGEGEIPALMVSWSRGLDSIMVNMTKPEQAPKTIDVSKTETYDEYLYEIPHAQTVPEEYWEVFNNPVCTWEDFSLEFVQKRMIAREDAGDTDTPRGKFSVLYPDGVLVYFNGRGTAEEIWELFESMDVVK